MYRLAAFGFLIAALAEPRQVLGAERQAQPDLRRSRARSIARRTSRSASCSSRPR
jgi:hypothetical protein